MRKIVPTLALLQNWAPCPLIVPSVDMSQKSETSVYISPLSLVDPSWSLIHGAAARGLMHSVVAPINGGNYQFLL